MESNPDHRSKVMPEVASATETCFVVVWRPGLCFLEIAVAKEAFEPKRLQPIGRM